jgi:Zn-finger protein
MKKLFLYLTSVTILFANNIVKAQDCDFYFPHKEGSVIETTYYDKKNKETGVATLTILENNKTADGQTVKSCFEF